MTDPIRIEELEDELLVLCARNTMLEARAKRLAAELELKNRAHVWAGNDPFTGEQVVGLLKENESLRARDRESEAMLIHYQQRLQVAEAHVARLAEALQFYAERKHYQLGDEWECASGESNDILCAPSSLEIDLSAYPMGLIDWSVENGAIARAALSAPDTQDGALWAALMAEHRALADATILYDQYHAVQLALKGKAK